MKGGISFFFSRIPREASIAAESFRSGGERQTHFAIHLFYSPGIPACTLQSEPLGAADDERAYEERHIAITIECSTEIEILTGRRRAAERTGLLVVQTPSRAHTGVYKTVRHAPMLRLEHVPYQ